MSKTYDNYEVNNTNPIGDGKTIDTTRCACCGYVCTPDTPCHCTPESIVGSMSPSPKY